MQFRINRDHIPPEATRANSPAPTEPGAPARLVAGSWTILAVLLLLLVGTGFVMYAGWTLADGIEVTTASYVAMAAGVILSLAVGCGLMALLFYSSRNGYDEPPILLVPESARQRLDSPPKS